MPGQERGQTDSLVTLKGMSADAAGWRQVPLNTNDLPKNLNHFVVSCEERYQVSVHPLYAYEHIRTVFVILKTEYSCN